MDCRSFHRLPPAGDVDRFGVEEEQAVVVGVGPAGLARAPGRPAQRDRGPQVDVVVVVLVPPGEVGHLVDGQQLVEGADHLAGELRAGGVDRLVPLRPGGLGRPSRSRGVRPSTGSCGSGRAATPGSRSTTGCWCRRCPRCASRRPSGSRRTWSATPRRCRPPSPARRGSAAGSASKRSATPSRLASRDQVPHRPVGLHDLGVAPLEELRDVARVDAAVRRTGRRAGGRCRAAGTSARSGSPTPAGGTSGRRRGTGRCRRATCRRSRSSRSGASPSSSSHLRSSQMASKFWRNVGMLRSMRAARWPSSHSEVVAISPS